MKVAKESYPKELKWEEHGWRYRIVNRGHLFDWYHAHGAGEESLLCTIPGGAYVVVRDLLVHAELIETEEVAEELDPLERP